MFSIYRGSFPGEGTQLSWALNFHFGIGVWPERPNRGACEQTTAQFGTLVNWSLTHLGALELSSTLILRLWSLKSLKICNLGVKVGSWEWKNAEMGVLRTARRAWKGVFRAAHTRTPFFREFPPPVASPRFKNLHLQNFIGNVVYPAPVLSYTWYEKWDIDNVIRPLFCFF